MAQVPYQGGIPTALPEVRPPGDYYQIPTRPQEFGAEIAQGAEKLGEGGTTAARFYGQVTAQDSANKWEDETNKILYGDPNTIGPDGQPDRGYYGLRGQAALDAMPSVRQKIVDLRDQYSSELNTPEQTFYFNQSTFRLNHFLMDEVGRHYDQNFQIYAGQANKATADLALTGIAQHPGDDNYVAGATDKLIGAYVKNLYSTGSENNPEAVQDAHNKARADALEARIDALSPSDPAHASSLLQSPDAALLKGPRFDALSAKLQNQTDAADAQRMVFGGAQAPGEFRAPPGVPVAGANPQEQQFLNEYRHRESGGNYGAQNPNSSASGAYGFVDQTWHEATRATGLGTQFAHAKDAPPAVQDANALWLHRDRGTQPWAASGPYPPAETPNIAAQLTQDPAVAQIVGQAGASVLNAPGLTQKLQEIQSSDANPRVKLEATRLAIETYNARYTDQERARTLREQQIKDNSEQRAGQIVTDAMSPTPTITAQQIGADPALTWETKLHLVEALKKEGTPGQEAGAYGPGFWSAYQGVTAAPGDPKRITDQNQILRRAGPGGDLTLAGVEKLNQTMAATKRPEAAGDTKMQAGALAYAKHQLSFEADYGSFKVRDPKGEDAFNIGFTPAFFKYWQNGIAAGKTPAELVDKKSLDQLVAPYKRPPAELMKDQLGANEEATGSAAAAPPDLTKMDQQQLVAAVLANPALREQAEGIALKNGWMRANPAPPIAGP